MFKKEGIQNIKNTETIIGESVVVEGEFNGRGNVVIEGKLNGNLTTDGHVLVGDKSEINADLHAGSAFISGKVIGNIKVTESLDVAKTADIKGDIEAKSIAMESGCRINGKLNINPDSSTERINRKQKLEIEETQE